MVGPNRPCSGCQGMTADASASAIQTKRIGKTYGKGSAAFQALRDVNIAIAENEFFTLLGPSGCGKTTLLRMIAGFDFPTEGQILLHGKDIGPLPPYQRPINTVFQNFALFPHMTVAENVGFGLKMLGWDRARAKSRVDEMLRLVRMDSMAGRATHAISGGQQQRVALARALAPAPKVLLLDEPLSALDYKLRKEMQGELKRLQHETGITFVFVTHDQEEALAMSDRIAVMNRGKVLQVGDPRSIYSAPADRFVADFIGESNLLTGRVMGPAGPGAIRVQVAGAEIVAHGVPDSDTALVMIRPEHGTVLFSAAEGALPAQLVETLYIGSETRLDLRLSDGTAFVARLPNSDATAQPLTPGQAVWLSVNKGSPRILRADRE
jgi:spermidine/putrescine transport system ATP-binding protein